MPIWRDYYNKQAKSDRLDSRILARLPLLHPEGLHVAGATGPGDPLKRAVKIRSGLVHRRTTSMQRIDCLLELMGPMAASDECGTYAWAHLVLGGPGYRVGVGTERSC